MLSVTVMMLRDIVESVTLLNDEACVNNILNYIILKTVALLYNNLYIYIYKLVMMLQLIMRLKG